MNIHDKSIKKLDVFNLSTKGIHLIEASAGTGKTFTIIIMYLRLLLGIGKNKTNIKKFLIHEILVVTFTNSAKEELYLRVKNTINNLYLACMGQKISDPCVLLLLPEIQDLDKAKITLKKAQNTINKISIYTIHGFCQKILESYTLHLNVFFKEKIIENEEMLYLQATQDFWRSSIYHLPKNIIKIIIKEYKNPDHFLKQIKPLLYMQSIIFKPKIIKNETLITYHTKIIDKINDFKTIWLKNNQYIQKILNNLNINQKIYNQYNTSRWIKDITTWSNSITENYYIPSALKYFSKENIKKSIIDNAYPKDIIFQEAKNILKNNFSLKNIIIFHALKVIPKFLLKEKKRRSLIGFNDLLTLLLKTIKEDKLLAKIISQKYPAAFIDEFQDTNIQQYRIFNLIYKNNNKTILYLIGDPKQAIYSFRGADIFSYLYAKSKIKNHYYLDTNWRSSVNMCKSINVLFCSHKNPFVFKNIPYISVQPSLENIHMHFKIKEINQASLHFFLQKKNIVNIEDHQEWVAKQCSNEISFWLDAAKKGDAIITTRQGTRVLQSNDIAILVKNQKEANMIQNALKKMNIRSTYSSCKNSIFQTTEAKELLWILQSVLDPTDENLLQLSFSTEIFIKLLSVKNNTLYSFIEKLYKYLETWEKIGIFCMIESIILEYQKNFHCLENVIDDQKKTNILHIAELLQKKSYSYRQKSSLIYWLQRKISQNNTISSSTKIRYVNDLQSIQIITIHKSKGLEYPIVWIPFAIHFYKSKTFTYHNKNSFQIFFDTLQSKESLKISDQEKLSEDLRLLYVALTRSILHCSIGIACVINSKKNDESDIHHNALGYIIQHEKPMNYHNLLHQLKQFNVHQYIKIKHHTIGIPFNLDLKNISSTPESYSLNKAITKNWKITSFSALKKENSYLIYVNNKIIVEEKFFFKKTKKNDSLTIHNFPSGKKTGLLIHYILKYLDFINKKDDTWFSNILQTYGFSTKWTPVLISWIQNIVNTPLNNKNITLSKLNKKEYVKELEFFLPIKKVLYNSELNKLIQLYDPISYDSPKISFNPIKGILKGFIDLLFFWDNKYYILDYKSNWIGEDNRFYSDANIKNEIIKHRYDLQYQIYTLAVHQYLTNKIQKYNYQDHFGGVFYMFLRGLENKKKYNGISYFLPKYSLIKQLSLLMLDKNTQNI